jgi:blue copper oxidase
MHLHGVQFRVLERIGGPDYEFFDEGWQDTTLVWHGQTVRILVPFEDHVGLFVYHCHNLEHEDQGMMRNFLIQ